MTGAGDVGDGAERPRQVSVAELLAQYGLPAATHSRTKGPAVLLVELLAAVALGAALLALVVGLV